MEPYVLSGLRSALNLSHSAMADLVGLAGANAADRVREMERGARPISGPMLRILGYLSQGFDLDSGTPGGLMHRIFPRWLDCSNLELDGGEADVIMHTRWPRFLAWVTPKIPDELASTLLAGGVPIMPMDAGLGLGDLAVFFIDQPAGDTDALIEDCIRLKEARVRRKLENKSQEQNHEIA